MTGSTNLFLVAAQRQFRFDSPKGQLTVEDLFTLPLTSSVGKANLNDIAVALFKKVKETDEGLSFVDSTPSAVNVEATQKLELVKEVIAIKKAEQASKVAAANRQAERQRLMELIQRKKEEADAGRSMDDLLAQLAALDAAQ